MKEARSLRQATLEALNRLPHSYFLRAGSGLIMGASWGIPFCFALPGKARPTQLDRLRRAGCWAFAIETPQEAVSRVQAKTGMGSKEWRE